MKILVEHEVPCEKRMEQTCLYPGDFWGNGVCKYHTHRGPDPRSEGSGRAPGAEVHLVR